MGHLKEQLQVKQPAFIVCLGNVAVQSFFQNPEVDVKSLRGKMHQVQGYQTAVGYHPLALDGVRTYGPCLLRIGILLLINIVELSCEFATLFLWSRQ